MADNYYPGGPDTITEEFYGQAAAERHQERYLQGIVDDWIPMNLDIVSDAAGVRSKLVLKRIVRIPRPEADD